MVDSYERQIRVLLAEWPRMSRVNRLAAFVDTYSRAGEITQCDRSFLWRRFPLAMGNRREIRAISACQIGLFETDCQAMIALPPIAPIVAMTYQIRLA